MKIFGEIQKIEPLDDGTIRVYGVASSEELDDQNEIVRGAAIRAAIPAYMRFPSLREMHDLKAAGTALEIGVDDDNVTRLTAHVVDPIAVLKVKTGTYRGFSIGGRVTQREPGNPKCITGLILNEVSLVDRPANPSSIIDTWKIADIGGDDGMAEAIGTIADTPAGEALRALVEPVQIWACGVSDHKHTAKAEAAACIEKRAAEGAAAAQDELRKAEAELESSEISVEPATKGAGPEPPPQETAPQDPDPPADGGFFNASDPADKASDSGGAFADPGYQADKKPRYKLNNPEQVRAAWSYIHMPKNRKFYTSAQISHIEGKIVAAWKDKIDPAGPPSAKKMAKRMVRKALEDAGLIASILASLDALAGKLDLESAMEGDDSPQPSRLRAWIADGCDFLNALVAEETGEIVSGTEVDPDQRVPIALSANVGSLSMEAQGKVTQLMSKLMNKGQEAGHQMGLDVAAMASKRAMGYATKKSDAKVAKNFCKTVLDAGATDLGAGGREMLTDGNPTQGAGEATNHATQDTGRNAQTTVPNPTGKVPANPVPSTVSMKAVATSAYIDGQMDELGKAAATAAMTPYQKLMMIAHDAIKTLSDGATCKAGGAKPDYLSRSQMDDLDTAHYHFSKGRGLSCDMAAGAAKAAAAAADTDVEDDPVVKAGEAEDLTKLELPTALAKALQEQNDRFAAQNAEIVKAVAGIAEALGATRARVEDIAKQEMPPVAMAKGTIVTEKGGSTDGGGMTADEFAAAVAKMTPEEIQMTSLKGTFLNGPDENLTARFGGRIIR